MKDMILPPLAELNGHHQSILHTNTLAENTTHTTEFLTRVRSYIKRFEQYTHTYLPDNEQQWLCQFARNSFNFGLACGDDLMDNMLSGWVTRYAISQAFAANDTGLTLTDPQFTPIHQTSGPYANDIFQLIGKSTGKPGFEFDLSQTYEADPYIPNVAPMYIISNYITRRAEFGKLTFETSQYPFLVDLDNIAVQLLNEVPDKNFDYGSIQVAGIRSRINILVMDYWLRERCYPAFLFGNWALNNMFGSDDYQSRWNSSNSLRLEDFTHAIAPEQVIHFDAVAKGVVGTLQRSLKDEDIIQRMRKLTGEIQKDPRLRVQMLATIIDRMFDQGDDGESGLLLNTVYQKISALNDLQRARVVIPNRDVDALTEKLIDEGKDVIVYLERNVNGQVSKTKYVLNNQSLVHDPVSEKMNAWSRESERLKASGSYQSIKIIKNIGVNSELQIFRQSDIKPNLSSRVTYKSISKEQVV